VRAEFERRFTAERMAHDYVSIYRQLLVAHRRLARTPRLNGRQSTLAGGPPVRSAKLTGEGEAQPINALSE
jgi:hypothetical protein